MKIHLYHNFREADTLTSAEDLINYGLRGPPGS